MLTGQTMSSSPQPRLSQPENQDLSPSDFNAILAASAKFKSRSHATYHKTHLPELTALPQQSITTVLIGDSMLERLKSTGVSTRTGTLDRGFNAGVGGDKIENVLYRLGLGMATLLQDRGVRLWVVMVGTNNLSPKRGLRGDEIEKYGLLLQALLRIAPRSRVLCCEIFRRKDVAEGLVEESNALLREMIEVVNAGLEERRIEWLDAPTGVTMERLQDHVHLNKEGYRIWDEVLFKRIEEMQLLE